MQQSLFSVCFLIAKTKSESVEKKEGDSWHAQAASSPLEARRRSIAGFAYNLDLIFPWDLLALAL